MMEMTLIYARIAAGCLEMDLPWTQRRPLVDPAPQRFPGREVKYRCCQRSREVGVTVRWRGSGPGTHPDFTMAVDTQPITPYRPICHSAELTIRKDDSLSTRLADELRKRKVLGQAGMTASQAVPARFPGPQNNAGVLSGKSAGQPIGDGRQIASEAVTGRYDTVPEPGTGSGVRRGPRSAQARPTARRWRQSLRRPCGHGGGSRAIGQRRGGRGGPLK